MAELSNMLRQRLAAAENGARVHPDADTLTAFAEQLLPAGERQQVMTHLAACGTCREVVALSHSELPETVMQPVIKAAPVSPWRRLFTPAMGLATSVAAIVVFTVVMLQIRQKPAHQQGQPSQEARVESLPDQKPQQDAKVASPDQVAGNESKPAAPAQEAPALSVRAADVTHSRKDIDETTRAAAVGGMAAAKTAAKKALPMNELAVRQPVTSSPQPVLAAGARRSDFVNTSLFAANGGAVVIDGQGRSDFPAGPQPRASETRFNSIANAKFSAFSDIPPNPTGEKSHMRMMPSPPPESPDHFGFAFLQKLEKGARSALRKSAGTAPAISGNALAFSAMGGPGKFSADLQKGQSVEIAAAPAKSEASALEQSEALSARSMSATGSSSGALATVWKVVDGKLMKVAGQSQWEDAYPAGGFDFTFVQSRGGNVWAGGTGAALIHSRDGGATWETVRLGDMASGSIVNVLFGGNSVQVKTSDDQSWSSSDGGKTWSLQSSQQ
ncbi:MAG: YCF48-related protein [Candidatus Angelobacter sp.]